MINFKNCFLSVVLTFTIFFALNQAKSQDPLNPNPAQPTPPIEEPSPSPPPPSLPSQPSVVPTQQPILPPEVFPTTSPPSATSPPPVAEEKKKRFHFFWQNEQKEKHKKELEDLKKKQKQEIEDLKKKMETEQIKEETFKKKVMEKQAEVMASAQVIIDERNKQIEEIKKIDNTVEIISSEEDPLYIKKAQVLKSKTNFMEIKDVEFKYKLELHNQTPKVINFVLIVWERRLAFNDTQTLAREMKVAKPIIPYEKRIFEYNELDSRRDGETYNVKIAKIVFEDGTQWKNPSVKDEAL